MKPRHQLSRAAIELIKRFEGYRRKAVQLPSGRWMLGHGHTLTARQGAEVSPEDAEALLLYDLIDVAHTVNEHVLTPLTQNQFDALCSFVFNIGTANFRNSAVLLRLNEGALLQAGACMELWRKADIGGERIIVDALVRRRAAEKNLFLTPPDGWVPVPSALLPPKLDHYGADALALEGAQIATLDQALAASKDDSERSATERSAAAVGARLQQILPEPEPPAGPVLRLTPAPEFDLTEPQAGEPEEAIEPNGGPTLFDIVPPETEDAEEPQAQPMTNGGASVRLVLEDVAGHSEPLLRHGWRTSAVLAVLGLAGLALSAGSLALGVSAPTGADGLDPQMIGWVGGLTGVSLTAFAAYLFLRGLSDEP